MRYVGPVDRSYANPLPSADMQGGGYKKVACSVFVALVSFLRAILQSLYS